MAFWNRCWELAKSDRGWEIVKMVIDKVVIVSIVGAAGLWLNSKIEASKNEQMSKLEENKQEKVASLEATRLKEAKEQFWRQKRLDALSDLAGQCSGMTEMFFNYAGKNETPNRIKEDYASRIDQARNSINRHSVVLGPSFDKRISPYIYLHRAFNSAGLSHCKDYLEMAGAIENALDGLYQAALNGEELPHLPLVEMDHKDRITLTSEEYLSVQKQYWEGHK